MKVKDKIRKIYAKNGIKVSDETIKAIVKDKNRAKALVRLYDEEEIKAMNYILGKSEKNKIFSSFEMELTHKIDLLDEKIVKICKKIYEKEKAGEEYYV